MFRTSSTVRDVGLTPWQATISSSLSKAFPAASSIQKWTPAMGHVYQTPAAAVTSRYRTLESKEATPMPDVAAGKDTSSHSRSRTVPDSRLAEESFAIHMRYGGEYMDENPITGKPGEFHLSSTGRKDKLVVPQPGKPTAPHTKTPAAETNPLAKDGKPDKAAKATGPPAKPKRRKSKIGTTTPS